MTKSFVQSAPAASFGNPDEPPQGAINTHGSPASVSDPIPGGVPQFVFRRYLAFRLADAHAARPCGSTLQYGSGGNRQIPAQQAIGRACLMAIW
jgi:hypothetical protein